jgi:hypothetical protein
MLSDYSQKYKKRLKGNIPHLLYNNNEFDQDDKFINMLAEDVG